MRKSASGSSSSRAAASASRRSSIEAAGSLAPGERDRERRRGVDLLGAGDRIAGARDLDRVAGQALRLGEDAVEHLELGERGQDRGSLGTRLARHELDRPPRGEHRPGRVARRRGGCGPAARGGDRAARGRAGHRGRRSPIRDRPSRATSGRPRRPPPRHGPGGRRGPRRAPPVAWPVRPVAGPRGATGQARATASSSAAAWRAPANAAASIAADRAAMRVVADQPVPGHGRRRPAQARREGRVVAGPRDRQQVARHGAPDRRVAERDGVAGLDQEAVRQRLAAARPQVGVEHAVALARSGHRAWRGAGRVDLERRGDRRQLVRRRAAGRPATAGAGPGGTPASGSPGGR